MTAKFSKSERGIYRAYEVSKWAGRFPQLFLAGAMLEAASLSRQNTAGQAGSATDQQGVFTDLSLGLYLPVHPC